MNSRLHTLVVSAVIVAGSLVAINALAEEEIILRRIVRKDFQDATFSAQRFQQAVASSLTKRIVVPKDGSISAIVRDKFNISSSWTPSVYSSLERHLLTTNGLEKATDLKEGQILELPDLPYTAKGIPKAIQAKPLSSTISTPVPVADGVVVALTTPSAPSSSALEMQTRLASPQELTQLQAAGKVATGLERPTDDKLTPLNHEMSVTLADGGGGLSYVQSMNASTRAALTAFLARPVRTTPILVVLDDSYPDAGEFAKSAEFVIAASKAIRRAFGLTDSRPGGPPNLKALQAVYPYGTTFCAGCEYPALKFHAAMIKKSLKEFQEAEPSGNPRVQAIYLPLSLTQSGSTNLMSEIVSLHILAESYGDQLNLLPESERDKPSSMQASDFEAADNLTKKIFTDKKLTEALVPYSGQEIKISTNKAIIDAVANFLWMYSEATARPYYLSMSWTTPSSNYPMLFRPNGHGLWLSASGNDATIDVQATGSQFAARSTDPMDVLAVMNMQAACNLGSSYFSANADLPVFGFAFQGDVAQGICGTSFSTPRVAWLLAGYEAVKGTPVVPGTASARIWKATTRASLMRMQHTGAQGEGRYAISLWDLLREKAPPQ